MDTADFNAENVNPTNCWELWWGLSRTPWWLWFHTRSSRFCSYLNNYKGTNLDHNWWYYSSRVQTISQVSLKSWAAIEYLTAHPEIKHGEIRVGFSQMKKSVLGGRSIWCRGFDVDFAYTVDGGPLGELQYETFSAAGAEITFKGRNVHPGTAKVKWSTLFN